MSSPSNYNQEPTESLLLPKLPETWEQPRKSVEFSQSSTKPKPFPSFPPQTLENERSLEGNGRSIEFSDGHGHHQRIVFPSPELPPVQFPNLDEDEKSTVNNQSDSQQIDNNKIDPISKLTNPQIASAGQNIKEISNDDDVDQSSLPEIEFGSNYVDDEAVVASQISAAGIDSYRPSFTKNSLKKRVRGSPISSSATSQDNPEGDDGKVKQATHSELENQLVLVVGSLTIVALVLILLIVLLLCRFVCYFRLKYSLVSLA